MAFGEKEESSKEGMLNSKSRRKRGGEVPFRRHVLLTNQGLRRSVKGRRQGYKGDS